MLLKKTCYLTSSFLSGALSVYVDVSFRGLGYARQQTHQGHSFLKYPEGSNNFPTNICLPVIDAIKYVPGPDWDVPINRIADPRLPQVQADTFRIINRAGTDTKIVGYLAYGDNGKRPCKDIPLVFIEQGGMTEFVRRHRLPNDEWLVWKTLTFPEPLFIAYIRVVYDWPSDTAYPLLTDDTHEPTPGFVRWGPDAEIPILQLHTETLAERLLVKATKQATIAGLALRKAARYSAKNLGLIDMPLAGLEPQAEDDNQVNVIQPVQTDTQTTLFADNTIHLPRLNQEGPAQMVDESDVQIPRLQNEGVNILLLINVDNPPLQNTAIHPLQNANVHIPPLRPNYIPPLKNAYVDIPTLQNIPGNNQLFSGDTGLRDAPIRVEGQTFDSALNFLNNLQGAPNIVVSNQAANIYTDAIQTCLIRNTQPRCPIVLNNLPNHLGWFSPPQLDLMAAMNLYYIAAQNQQNTWGNNPILQQWAQTQEQVAAYNANFANNQAQNAPTTLDNNRNFVNNQAGQTGQKGRNIILQYNADAAPQGLTNTQNTGHVGAGETMDEEIHEEQGQGNNQGQFRQANNSNNNNI